MFYVVQNEERQFYLNTIQKGNSNHLQIYSVRRTFLSEHRCGKTFASELCCTYICTDKRST